MNTAPTIRDSVLGTDVERGPRLSSSLSWLERLPVTTILGTQYLALVLVPALISGRKEIGIIVMVLGVAALGATSVELILAPLARFPGRNRTIHVHGAQAVTAVGFLGAFASALAGASTYSSQIGSTNVSPIAALFTPLEPWTIVGIAWWIHSARTKNLPTRSLRLAIPGAISLMLLQGVLSGRLAPAMAYALGIAFVGWRGRVFAAKHLFAGLLAVLLAWPALYAVRNDVRVSVGGHQTELRRHAATDRLSLDKFMADLDDIEPPIDLGQPGAVEILRFGLIPRFLDTNRGEVSTGQLLSASLGMSAYSAYTFTGLGNVYAFSDWHGLIIFAIFVALSMGCLIRIGGAIAFALSALLVQELLWVEFTYPDGIIRFLQGAVALLGARLFVPVWMAILSQRRRHAGAGQR